MLTFSRIRITDPLSTPINSLAKVRMLSRRSVIPSKKRGSPKMNPRGTPALIGYSCGYSHVEKRKALYGSKLKIRLNM